MIEAYIKYLFMIMCAIYLFSKLLNIKVSVKLRLVDVAVCVVLSGIVYIFRMKFPYITMAILFVTLAIYVLYVHNLSLKITIIASLLSVVLSYTMFTVATVIISFITSFSVFRRLDKQYLYPVSMLMVGGLQVTLSCVVFKIKRLGRGMPFLLERISNTLGVVLGCAIVFFSSLFMVINKEDSLYYVLMLICTMLGFVLFIWWRKQLNISYIIRSNKNEILRFEQQIEKLKKDNEKLSSLIHKDNKLIPAMEMSVRTLFEEMIILKDDALNEKAKELLTTLIALSQERAGILEASKEGNYSIESTGCIRLDAVIKYMYEKAKESDIQFNVTIDADIRYMLKHIVKEDILVTIIADMVDNAIVATRVAEEKHIMLSISMENGHYTVSIYDSGIPFEIHTIINAGKVKASTHLDEGGSGIGLMTIFSFINQNLASFVIDEVLEVVDVDKECMYTKRVAVMFDYQNQYRINSYRSDVLDLKRDNPRIIING